MKITCWLKEQNSKVSSDEARDMTSKRRRNVPLQRSDLHFYGVIHSSNNYRRAMRHPLLENRYAVSKGFRDSRPMVKETRLCIGAS